MSGETKDHVSGWTVDTLGQHFSELRRADRDGLTAYFEQGEKRDVERDRRLDERAIQQEVAVAAALAAAEKAVVAAMAAAEKAVAKAETAQQKQADSRTDSTDRENAELRSQIDALRGTRREGVGMTADVVAKLAGFALTAIAIVVSVYIATH